MKNENEIESEEERKKQIVPIYAPVIMELEKFQEHIDDPKKKMLVRDLRSWAGHINYIISRLLMDITTFIFKNAQFTAIKKQIEKDIKTQEKRDEANSGYFS